jgi:hypothetical protein
VNLGSIPSLIVLLTMVTMVSAAPPRDPVPWPSQVEWAYRRATQVFIGLVVNVEVKSEEEGEIQVGRVQPLEVLKGLPIRQDAHIYKRIPSPTDTFVPFVRNGTTVLVFADSNGDFLRVVKEDDADYAELERPGPYVTALQKVRELCCHGVP